MPPSPAETLARHVAWLTATGNYLLHYLFHDLKKPSPSPSPSPLVLGILASETAKTMTHLVSLYNSVSEDEICSLRSEIVTSTGIAYLSSGDEIHLLLLAYAERLSELNASVEAVAWLNLKCSDPYC